LNTTGNKNYRNICFDPHEGPRYSDLQPLNLTQTGWLSSWNKAQEGQRRTFVGELQNRIMKTFVRFHATYPVWSAIITKTWLWCLRKVGIQENNMNGHIIGHRRQLHDHMAWMWELRTRRIETNPTKQNSGVCGIEKQRGKRPQHAAHPAATSLVYSTYSSSTARSKID